jgi:hypothetical protein
MSQMKTYIFILLSLILTCCDQTPAVEDVKAKICASARHYAASKSEGHFTVDTVWVVRLDTLTDKAIAEREAVAMQQQFNHLQSQGEVLNSIYRLAVQKAALNKSLFGRNDALTQISIDDMGKAERDAESNLEQMRAVSKSTDSMINLINSGAYDSSAFRGYLPKVFLSMVDKSGAISGDTFIMMIDSKFHVMETHAKQR